MRNGPAPPACLRMRPARWLAAGIAVRPRPGQLPGHRTEQAGLGQAVLALDALDDGQRVGAEVAGADEEGATLVHLRLPPGHGRVMAAERWRSSIPGQAGAPGRSARSTCRLVRAAVRRAEVGAAGDADVADVARAGVGVLVQAEDARAGPRLPSALAVQDERAGVLLGSGRVVGVAPAADAAPRGQVELVGAVVTVTGVDRVVVARFAIAQPAPGRGRRVGRRAGQGDDQADRDRADRPGAERRWPGSVGDGASVPEPIGSISGDSSTSRSKNDWPVRVRVLDKVGGPSERRPRRPEVGRRRDAVTTASADAGGSPGRRPRTNRKGQSQLSQGHHQTHQSHP